MDCYSANVVATYKCLKSHWPTFTSKDLAELANRAQPMFLVPKPKFKKFDQVWFLKSSIDKNPLGKIVKTLVKGMLKINCEGHTLINKTTRHIGIS